MKKRNKMVTFWLYASFFFSLATPISLFIYNRVKEKEEKKNKIEEYNRTTPTSTLTPNNNAVQLGDEDVIEITVGGMGTVVKVKELKRAGVKAPIQMDNYEPVIIKLDAKNNLLVSSKIYDNSGKIVAEIVDNTWRINPNNVFTREFNNNMLQVIDNYGNVVLAVNFLSSSTIVIHGVFCSPDGILFAFDQSSVGIPSKNNPMAKILEEKEKRSWDSIYNEYARKVKRLF